MTEREQIIANLLYMKRDCLEGSDTDKTLDRAIDLLKRDVPETNVGEWISVKDRLPEEPGQYLCWFGANKLAIGPAIASYVDKWKAFGRLETLKKYPNITHWMPIPEPPKEG